MPSISAVTPTVCRLMGVFPPKDSSAEPIPEVLELCSRTYRGKADRVLLYAPDALSVWLYERYKALYTPINAIAPLRVPMRSVMPTKTPVCYASMFTGAQPEVHGIRKPERPVLTCDTLFDALARAGRQVAIAAVKGSSIDLIFRNRKITYFTEEYDPQVNDRVLKILSDFDFILAYNQEYDDLMHGSTPTSPQAVEALKRHIGSFRALGEAYANTVRGNRVIGFVPDHGTHIDPVSGKGTHGTDSPEDMNVYHFWGAYKG